MIPVIVVRPQPGCDATVDAALRSGLDARGFPLFEVQGAQWDAPDPVLYDALLIGSANALRHGGRGLEALHGLPVYAVGEATASAAREAGFAVTSVGSGGLQSLLHALEPGHRRLLRLAGRERVALTAPPGVLVEERVIYVSEPQPMTRELERLLHEPAVVLLHSAQAARHMAGECARLGIDRSGLDLGVIGTRVAEAAGHGWRGVAVAASPDDTALLALAAQLCQTAT